jgi:hypothetical protein
MVFTVPLLNIVRSFRMIGFYERNGWGVGHFIPAPLGQLYTGVYIGAPFEA